MGVTFGLGQLRIFQPVQGAPARELVEAGSANSLHQLFRAERLIFFRDKRFQEGCGGRVVSGSPTPFGLRTWFLLRRQCAEMTGMDSDSSRVRQVGALVPLTSWQRRALPDHRDLEVEIGSTGTRVDSGLRVSVQDSESIGGTTVVFGMADSIQSLKRQVASRFLYDNVVLYSQHGARIDDLSMIPPDEVILATDGKPFPAETRVLFTSGAGELRSLPAMSSERSMNTAESQGRVAHGCHG